MSGGKGIPKTKWSEDEEKALKAGVDRYGPGKWRFIQKDEELSPMLKHRSNVDLKDKWRNLNVMSPGGSTSSPKPATPASTAKVLAVSPAHTPPPPPASVAKLLGKRKIEQLIVEAVSALKEKSGSSQSSISKYVEENLEHSLKLPPNFKAKLLGELLTSLSMDSGKLLKVKSLYKLADKPAATPRSTAKAAKSEAPAATPTPAPKSGRKAAKTSAKMNTPTPSSRSDPPTPGAPSPVPIASLDTPTALVDIKTKIENNKSKVLKEGDGRGRKGGAKEKAFHAAELALEAALQAVLDAEECKKAAEQASIAAVEAEREAVEASAVAEAAAEAVLSGK
mmetsp:Transcript_16990/g.28660  ORF Transcript_16990/g.28660 Transcript_16990/m.28660 type:complete len:337 (-) Transcript_16990:440-1450(-)|eukprot:CAMPEP_0198199952 /NCGR_PEP_ID=MMETSP1445-20131203/3045_1 /TAXON_ID=36898 /ORGANISM="Pyramimonas sp., Strain CCMP2087" /LENGTH=336 /DNA_ID=CAMNT_0043869865 /DNA_START=196 /DNA_END=1206 /DNA_ORIENTATION=-